MQGEIAWLELYLHCFILSKTTRKNIGKVKNTSYILTFKMPQSKITKHIRLCPVKIWFPLAVTEFH